MEGKAGFLDCKMEGFDFTDPTQLPGAFLESIEPENLKAALEVCLSWGEKRIRHTQVVAHRKPYKDCRHKNNVFKALKENWLAPKP